MQQTLGIVAGHKAGPPLELRDYQVACLDALRVFGMSGGRRALVAMATGLGKTIIFAHIAGTARKRVMVVAHRDTLLEQAADKIGQAFPTLQIEIEQAGRRASDSAQVVIASVQTLAASRTRDRLARFDPNEFSALIIDEAHHATATTYIRVLAHFGLAPSIDDLEDVRLTKKERNATIKERFAAFTPDPSAPFLVGVTATPARSDRTGLENIFDEIVFEMSMLDGMEAGWLAKIRGLQVNTGVDISKIKTRKGDYSEKELAVAVNVTDRNLLTVGAYGDYAEGLQTLVFAVDVAHTIALTTMFRAAGYKAAYVIGDKHQMDEPREDIIAAYQRRDIQILINCQVLTEGFDAPETACIIMAAPTKSQLSYTQKLGRGTRIAPEKVDCLVIDMADTAGLGVANMNTLFGFPPRLKMPIDSDVLTVRGELEAIGDSLPKELFEMAETVVELRTKSAQYDPLAAIQMEPGLRAELRWVRTTYGLAISVPVAGGPPVRLGIVEDMLGMSEIRMSARGRKVSVLGSERNTQNALAIAEAWINITHPDGANLLKKNAGWHKDEPSGPQIKYAKRLRIPLPPGATKGDLSKLIDAKMSGKKF